MPSDLPVIEPMVLVVYANFAVGAAIGQRLMDSAVVSLATPASALRGLGRDGGHDVLVLCPYVHDGERQALLVQAEQRSRPVAVVEVAHDDETGGVRVAVVSDQRRERAAARVVLAALSPIAA